MVKFGRLAGLGNVQPNGNFDLFGHGNERRRLHINGLFDGHGRFWKCRFYFRNRQFLHL